MAARPKTDYKTVDEYIAAFPPDVRIVLERLRATIRETVPDMEEAISYQMPAFKHHGVLVYLSAFKKHYSLFIPSGPVIFEAFQDELSAYKISKSTLQLPKDAPVPYDLIARIIRFKADLNAQANIPIA